jgi:hypothetical protein
VLTIRPIAKLWRHPENDERAKALNLFKELFDRPTINPSAVVAITPRLTPHSADLAGHSVDQDTAATSLALRSMELIRLSAKRSIFAAPPPLKPRFDLRFRQLRKIVVGKERRETWGRFCSPKLGNLAAQVPVKVVGFRVQTPVRASGVTRIMVLRARFLAMDRTHHPVEHG